MDNGNKKERSHVGEHGSRFFIILFFIALACWISATFVKLGVNGESVSIDLAINRWLFTVDGGYPLGSRGLTDAARDITALGSALVLMLTTLVGFIYFILIKQTKLGLIFAGVVSSSFIINTLLKIAIARTRPELASPYIFETSHSFPSGHAMVSAVLYCSLALSLGHSLQRRSLTRYFEGVAFVLLFLVGLSRVLLGAHYLTDVLAGWTLGIGWVLLCILCMRLYLLRRA